MPLIHERERERQIQEEKYYEESERRRLLFFHLEEHKRRSKEHSAQVMLAGIRDLPTCVRAVA